MYKLDLLDTPAEERFDYITEKAKLYFKVPIALITLVDESRQWFKSRQGLEVTETSRDISFCGHAINESDIFNVPDTFLDERFIDNPLVTGEPHIRFYAGAPIRSKDGFVVGTLCIIDDVPRTLVSRDLIILRELAHLVENEIVG